MNRCAVVHLALDPGLMLDPEGGARRAQGPGAGEGARRPACPPPSWGWRLGLAALAPPVVAQSEARRTPPRVTVGRRPVGVPGDRHPRGVNGEFFIHFRLHS